MIRKAARFAVPAGLALAATLALTAAPVRPTSAGAADGSATLTAVGHSDLGTRGLNAGLALAGRCAYVGSRGQGPVAIVDVADPANPRVVGSLAARSATTPRELRAVPDRRLLVVMRFALGGGGVNRFDIYTWSTSCASLTRIGRYDFGSEPPHEFYLWRDPANTARILLFTAMFKGGDGALRVIDITNPASPVLRGSWSAPIGRLHSLSVSADGRRAYLALWDGGLLVGDVSQFTAGAANPQLTLLTPAGSALPALPGGNVHSAVQVPGTSLLVLSDERYPQNCPYGPARIADVSDPSHPRQVSVLAAPENDPAVCAASPVGAYTSHNPTIVGGLALTSWYSSGVQVFDVRDPAQPVRLAEFRAQDSEPGARDGALGATLTMTWSYPIVRDGLIYVADVNEGLYVLRYTGPIQDAIAQVAFAEGNSNL